MTIYIDPRAGSGDLLPLIQPSPRFATLDSGDVMFTGWGPGERKRILIGMEVKKLSDALQCMQDGRLISQLRRMHDDYDLLWFILEGEIRPDPEHGYLQQKLHKRNPKTGRHQDFWCDAIFGNREKIFYQHFMEWMLLSIGYAGGCTVLRSGSRDETGHLIGLAYRWFSKPWEEHKSLYVFDNSQRPQLIKPSRAAEVAHDLADGIGWEKAMAAAEHFGTVRSMVNASVKDWTSIPGIGKVLAERVVAGVDETHRKVVRQKQRKRKD